MTTPKPIAASEAAILAALTARLGQPVAVQLRGSVIRGELARVGPDQFHVNTGFRGSHPEGEEAYPLSVADIHSIGAHGYILTKSALGLAPRDASLRERLEACV
jgi:hypothetical protein